MSRALYAEMLGFLGLPAGIPQPRLAYLLKAIVQAFGGNGAEAGRAPAAWRPPESPPGGPAASVPALLGGLLDLALLQLRHEPELPRG